MFLSLLAALIGCQKPSGVERILDGSIPVDDAERQALSRLVAALPEKERELELREGGLGIGSRGITLADGHVVELGVIGLPDPALVAPFGRLQNLRLWRGGFADLSGLGEHPELKALFLAEMEPELAGLSNHPGLESLELLWCPIESLEPLPPIPALRSLRVSHAKLTGLEGISKNPQLESLDLEGNEITDLGGLTALSQLTRLRLDRNPLTSLASLPTLPQLQTLSLGRTGLDSLESLTPQPELVELNCFEGDLTRIGRLEGVPKLTRLGLMKNEISDLSGVEALPALTRLDLSWNSVSDLEPLTGCPKLEWVDIKETEVTFLPEGLEKNEVQVAMDPRVETDILQETFKRRIEAQGNFVEKLPTTRGSARNVGGSIKFSAGTFRSPKVEGVKRIGELSGAIHLELVGDRNPLSPASGGPNNLNVSVEMSVEEGTARVYFRSDIDYRAMARLFTGHQERSDKLITFGDQRPEGSYRKGFAWAEATPGSPVKTGGEAMLMVDSYLVVVEAIDGPARGITLKFTP